MRVMLKLALPVTISYLGLMVMGLVDLIAVGHVGAVAVGAVGIGNSIFSWLMISGIGLITGLDYLVGHAHGAKDDELGFRYFAQSLHISVWLSVTLTGVMIFLSYHLSWLGLHPEVRPVAESYLRVLAPSLLAALLFTSCRQYLTAVGIAKPAMLVLVVANLINALFNYLLVFGNWGFPEMGATGSAWATLISRLWMVLAMGGVLWSWDRRHRRFISRLGLGFDRTLMKALLKMGLPAALQMNFEVGVFALATALAGRLTPVELAAHQLVLNIASVTFMVPLGVGSAAAVLVGQALGARDRRLAALHGRRAFILGVGFMCLTCLTFLSFPRPLLGMYTVDSAVIEMGTRILFLAAIFQIADGIQVVGTGALRGLGDTRSAMIANLAGHWFIGLPVGVYLCFKLGFGLWGLWVGLATGLIAVAIALIARWRAATAKLLLGADSDAAAAAAAAR